VDARLRRPTARAARAYHETRRTVRRIVRPTGLAICLAGPDGVGKSTLTQALLALSGGPFHTRIRLGQRRGYFRKPGELLRRPQADANRPHHRRPSNLAGSAARLVYMWLDALVGWLPKIGVPRRRTTLVVLERPFVDFAIDPRRYRLSTPPALARALARLLPRPDLVLVLTAPARAVHRRKRELAIRELERQLAAWRGEATRNGYPVLDASGAPAETFAAALDQIDEVLARRHGDLGAARAAYELLGSPSRTGTSAEVFRQAFASDGIRTTTRPIGGLACSCCNVVSVSAIAVSFAFFCSVSVSGSAFRLICSCLKRRTISKRALTSTSRTSRRISTAP